MRVIPSDWSVWKSENWSRNLTDKTRSSHSWWSRLPNCTQYTASMDQRCHGRNLTKFCLHCCSVRLLAHHDIPRPLSCVLHPWHDDTGQTSFVDCWCFGRLDENCLSLLAKQGRLLQPPPVVRRHRPYHGKCLRPRRCCWRSIETWQDGYECQR